jgi:hypothetical protein
MADLSPRASDEARAASADSAGQVGSNDGTRLRHESSSAQAPSIDTGLSLPSRCSSVPRTALGGRTRRHGGPSRVHCGRVAPSARTALDRAIVRRTTRGFKFVSARACDVPRHLRTMS